jgi:hypothetical protein
MSTPRRRRLSAIAVALSVAVIATGPLPIFANASGTVPSVRLVTGTDNVTLKRPEGRRAYLDLSTYVAAVGGAFEIWAARLDYDHPAQVWQVVRENGVITKYPLPPSAEEDWLGLDRFLHVTVTDDAGAVVMDRYRGFCPGSGELARLSVDGPDIPTYPQFCGGNPFTLGAVWGIDDGWASNAFGYYGAGGFKGPDGHYTATVSITPEYQSLFGVAASDASVSISIRLKTLKHDYCYPYCPRDGDGGGHGSVVDARSRMTSVPIMTDPDPSVMPDLVSLPAWGISIDHQRHLHRDYLDFGATVWDRGPSPMVVEGFRRQGEPIMDAWEFFYSNGVAVGRIQAGDLMYDNRPGHQHWHFEQFARYSLLAEDQAQIVRSEKTGFCLAPTDAIDLTATGAEWNPYSIGLGTACGGRGSLWTREVLPAGWGDTYFQGLPGQSFDITHLPNGTYYIAVQANPDGLLTEVTAANNTELRQVILGGTRGHRTVEVPPWHGIDTEGPFGGGNSGGGGGGAPIPLPASSSPF